MSTPPKAGTKLVGAYLDRELQLLVLDYAEKHALSTSAVVRMALEAFCGGRSRYDAAFNEGLNKGLAEARAAIAKALNAKWR